MTEVLELDLMKKFKELNVAEYTTKYGGYYGLMFAGAEIATKELQEENKKLKKQIEKMKCGQNCKYSYLYQEDRKCSFTYCDCINCKDKWEFGKEIKEK